MIRQQRKIKFLEVKEVKAIIAAIPQDNWRDARDHALLEVLFSTGLRISEALSLDRYAMADMLAVKGTSEFVIVGKGGYQRVVFFSPVAKQAMRDYNALTSRTPDTRFFDITPRMAQITVTKWAKVAGFGDRKVTPHMFRHSFATHLLRKGANIRVVQEMLGHHSLTSTMVYTGVTNNDLKEAHKKFMI